MLNMSDPGLQTEMQTGLQELIELQGALVVALGNWRTGQCFAQKGIDSPLFPNSKIGLAVEGNAKVIQAKMQVSQALKFQDKIDQILIALSTQWHLMKVLSADGYFIYIALERASSNMAVAGFKLMQLDKKISPLLNSN
ncbi:hypothetical protein [Pseudanabaena sp. PCC 6802]|uniref:hypothetical protein n=1 Tax=Pseudanabaena sp. PCC 6802 TaxID=118173 RepID=UPI000348479F|nr:hypothetical protein [Pseudanabaena sp. PCC 6802]